MVQLSLTNRNPHSRHHSVIINLSTRVCTFDDKQDVDLKYLLTNSDFNHPLLTEPFTSVSDHVFHHEYDDVDGLLYAAIYVYSTLIHVDNPFECKFKINPSSAFQHAKVEKHIYFSINSQEPAKELVSITQLEKFIGEMGGFKFNFSEDTLIHDEFTIDDLPALVKGDALYDADPKMVGLLKTPIDHSRYELRYINGDVGLGVFARSTIPKGDIIAVYTGIKTIHLDPPRNYAYIPSLDALNMYLDARPHGNIARFINHALRTEERTDTPSQPLVLNPNNSAMSHYLNGIEITVYVANREILSGEQLLVDYGELFFKNKKNNIYRFGKNGEIFKQNNAFTTTILEKELRHKMIMATHGVHKAQTYMLKRMLKVVMVIVISMCALNYLF